MRYILNDRTQKEDAAFVLDTITEIKEESCAVDEHFFSVLLEDVNNGELLNVDSVREYLEFVAPLPYSSSFLYQPKISKFIQDNKLNIDEYNVYLNEDQLFKGYCSSIYDTNGKKNDELIDVKCFIDEKNEPMYWGWYGISTFEGVISSAKNPMRGIRLRSHNIQLGKKECLDKYFKDPRGNHYFVGEVYAIDKNLFPNSQRNQLTDNNTKFEFEKKIARFFDNELNPFYRDASKVRSAAKRIQAEKDAFEKYNKKQAEGFVDSEEKERLESDLTKKKQESEKAKKELASIEKKSKSDFSSIFERIKKRYNPDTQETIHPLVPSDNNKKRNPHVTDVLTTLSKNERKLVGEVFSIIKKVLSPEELADQTIKKIISELQSRKR